MNAHTQTFERAHVQALVAYTEALNATKPVRLNTPGDVVEGVFLERALFGPNLYGVCDAETFFVVFPIVSKIDVAAGDIVRVSFLHDPSDEFTTLIERITEQTK